ncbi:MAG: beta-agarase [Verrucomicrobia bacterium]|nr:beta-agarase [Verrucomicrobiota bacterium]
MKTLPINPPLTPPRRGTANDDIQQGSPPGRGWGWVQAFKADFIRGILALTFALLALAVHAAESRDRFGGWDGVRGQATGFFHTEQIQGVWWLITPDGNAFLSKGVNHVSYTADQAPSLGYAPYARVTAAQYGSAQKWAEATAARLKSWGFNTVGAWSSREMSEQSVPHTLILNLAASAGANWLKGEVADVFSPKFEEAVRRQAQRLCLPRARDPFLIGYFSDNELRWGSDWRSKKSLLEDFLARPSETPGKQAAWRILRRGHDSFESFNKAWGTAAKDFDKLANQTSLPMGSDAAKSAQRAFLREYARTYFKLCRDAIKAADANHLVIGCRFAGAAPQEVIEGMAEFVDVVSFNNYGFTPPAETLRNLHRATGKPILLTEFSFKAQDSGLPNTKGAGKPVSTQQDRAGHFDRYVTELIRMPFMVGFHWFEYCDEPAEGRFDGENSNYGLVNIQDEPWQVLVERMTQVNAGLEEMHSRSR